MREQNHHYFLYEGFDLFCDNRKEEIEEKIIGKYFLCHFSSDVLLDTLLNLYKKMMKQKI